MTPGSPKRSGISIYAGSGWERWAPSDIATQGLGGSETAAFRLAESLSELGYVVTLYGECDHALVNEVLVRDWRTFNPIERRNALISLRHPEVFDREIEAEQKLLWLQDVDSGDRLTVQRAQLIDRILCVSGWHEAHLAARYPFAAEKLARIRNGITPSYFTAEPAPVRKKRVLYTSAPARGLDILLEMWPLVRQRVPDAELVHTSAPVYERIAENDPRLHTQLARIRELADQPGVRGLSGLPQPELAELMRSSLVWTHPAYMTPYDQHFMETSCIGAMEAQAGGCCVVAGDWGALSETVQVGALIDGHPTHESFRARFTEAIVAGLTDERVQANAQTAGPEAALRWGWDGVAAMVAELIEDRGAAG